MCVYIYIYIYIYVCIYIYIYIYIISVLMHTYIYTYIHIYIYIYIYIYLSLSLYLSIYIYIYVIDVLHDVRVRDLAGAGPGVFALSCDNGNQFGFPCSERQEGKGNAPFPRNLKMQFTN